MAVKIVGVLGGGEDAVVSRPQPKTPIAMLTELDSSSQGAVDWRRAYRIVVR